MKKTILFKQRVLWPVFLLMLTGCASGGYVHTQLDHDPFHPQVRVPPPAENRTEEAEASISPLTAIKDALWTEITQWRGVPYRWGGTSYQAGVDCSGFALRVYQRVFGIHLPRTTTCQVKAGRQVHKGRFQPGDLLFFRDSDYSRHVGIYLQGNLFAHSSREAGKVVVSDLRRPYWQRTYWTSRRLLPCYPSDRSARKYVHLDTLEMRE